MERSEDKIGEERDRLGKQRGKGGKEGKKENRNISYQFPEERGRRPRKTVNQTIWKV